MTSKLEEAVIVKGIREHLLRHLDDGTSLYCLRTASRTLRDHVDLQQPGRLWGTLYMHAPLRPTDNNIFFTLEGISPGCHTLFITVRIPDRTTTTVEDTVWPQNLGAYELDRQLWAHIFKGLKNLQALTLRVEGNPGWPGRGEVEHTLTTLRCALERAALSKLRSLFLAPVHICGILHLHWHGFGALYEVALPRTCRDLWQSITLLDIRLSSPMHTNLLTEAQTAMSIKLLHGYLRSFAPTLRCFLFVWLDGEGPSPLLLDDEPGMERIQRVFWPRLEVLCYGNVTVAHRTIQALSDRAPNVKVVKVLSRAEAVDREVWVEVGVEGSMDRPRQVANSTASSFYSQDGV